MLVSFYRSCERDLRGRSRNVANVVLRFEFSRKGRKDSEVCYRFALRYTNAASKDVRLRCATFASDLLQAFNGVPIEDGLLEYVGDMFMSLLEDKSNDVRKIAARTLGTIATNTTIIDALGGAVNDGVAAVKTAVLKSLGDCGSWGDYAADIVVRVKDVDVDVRVEAFKTLTKGEPKWFLIDHMREVLLAGFMDTEDKVQVACSVLLLKRWLPFFDNDPEHLIQQITSDEREQDIIMKAFVKGGLKLSADYFRSRIDDMSPEAARLWQAFVEDLPQDQKEDVLPSLEAFCAVLTHYSTKRDQFACLCSLIGFYDLSLYEPARALLSETLREILRDEDNEDEVIRGAAQGSWLFVCFVLFFDVLFVRCVEDCTS